MNFLHNCDLTLSVWIEDLFSQSGECLGELDPDVEMDVSICLGKRGTHKLLFIFCIW